MGRPLQKRFFSDPSSPGAQLRLFANLGSGSVLCHILEQKGTGKYIVAETGGTAEGVIYLVDNNTPDVGEGYIQVSRYVPGTEVAVAGAVTYTVVSLVGVESLGQGYTAGDTVTVAGGDANTAAVITVDSVDGDGGVTSASLTTAGDYNSVPRTVVVQDSTSGSGVGASFQLDYGVLAVAVSDGGSGYTSAPSVQLVDNYGTGVDLTATLTADEVSGFTVNNAGSGFRQRSNPTVNVVGELASTLEYARVINQYQVKTFSNNTYVWDRNRIARDFDEATLIPLKA